MRLHGIVRSRRIIAFRAQNFRLAGDCIRCGVRGVSVDLGMKVLPPSMLVAMYVATKVFAGSLRVSRQERTTVPVVGSTAISGGILAIASNLVERVGLV